MANTPFKFLDSYAPEDKDVFFGREKEIEELYYKIFESNLLIVYGSSGTCKTSIIQCGLAGKFLESDWLPIIIRRGSNINESVTKALNQLALTPLKAKNSVVQNIQSIYLDHFKPIFLLFDQFEELFIFGNENEINEFINNLKNCLEANLSCRFIFILRGEYLENLAVFEDKIPSFFSNRIRIEKMTRKNASSVITEPAKLFNIKVSADFPTTVIDRLSGGKSSVELTYLQVYLDRLYKSALKKNPQNPVFDKELIDQSGQFDDILAEFLEEQISKTDNPNDALNILKAFVSNEGTKKQMSSVDVLNFLKAIEKSIPPESVDKYILQFIDLRILKDKDESGKFELRHDALAAKIFEKISFSEKELLEIRQFISNRFNDYRKRGSYLEASDLEYILPYRNRLSLDDEQKKFVDASFNISRRKKRRTQNIIIGSAISLFSVLSIFTIFAMIQRNKAVEQSKIADQKTIEAQNQREMAEKAKEQSIAAAKNALDAKAFAELQKNIADSQSKIAIQQKNKADAQSNLALQEKSVANQNAQKAKEQSEIANQQKKLADEEKEKALIAQSEANRLRLISLSENLAFKSQQLKNDAQLSALLSLEAYNLAVENRGNIQDPQIYNSLFQNLKNFSAENYPYQVKLSSEVGALNVSNEDVISLLSLDGQITRFGENTSKPISTTSIGNTKANTAYMSFDCKTAMTAYDDFSIRIWNTNTGVGTPSLIGHHDFVRCASFGNDGLVVTGGRDSLVILWKNNQIETKLTLPSRVKALAIIDYSSCLAGCEDGLVYKCNFKNHNITKVLDNSSARINSITSSNHGKCFIVSSSKGQVSILNADLAVIKSFSEGYTIDHTAVEDESGYLAVAIGNHVIHVYNLNNLSQKPLEISDIKSVVKGICLSKNGNLTVACGNGTLREYTVKSDKLANLLKTKTTRILTTDEWATYIGNDTPFKQ